MPILFNHASARIHRHQNTKSRPPTSNQVTSSSGGDDTNNEKDSDIQRSNNTTNTMGKTVNRQALAKQELDRKLSLSAPTRELLEELAVACAKDPTPHAKFQYAFALSKSSEPSELRYAVTILDGLVAEGYEHQVDCMYGAATALYLLGDYQEARARCEAILRSQPNARIAKELHLASIEAEEEEQREHLKQAAVGSVAVAAAIGVVAGIAMLMKKR